MIFALFFILTVAACCPDGIAGDGGVDRSSLLNPTPIEKIEYRNRSKIEKCIKRWVDEKIPYCQCNGPSECCGDCPYCKTTRCDCSGYVSHCWGVEGYTTWTLGSISHSIEKEHLKKGDILLYVAGEHVVFFFGWENEEKTKYHCCQEAGCHSSYPDVASNRVVNYPMSWGDFKPRRFNYVRED